MSRGTYMSKPTIYSVVLNRALNGYLIECLRHTQRNAKHWRDGHGNQGHRA